MPKQTASLSLSLPPRDAGSRANEWLSEALRSHILEGQVRRGARLPSTRGLAREYGLSRGTIVRAFEQLKSEGYLEGSVGSGTFVTSVLPEELLHVRHRAGRESGNAATARRRSLSGYGRRAKSIPADLSRPLRAFRINQPALDLFPTSVWSQLAARRSRLASPRLLLGCEPMGYRPLQEAVAEYLRTSR